MAAFTVEIVFWLLPSASEAEKRPRARGRR
jgi:hypothetical protein